MEGEELIQTIDQLYFRDENDFNLYHLIDDFPQTLTSDYLLEHKGKLEKVLSVVSRKVSELILNHQPTYVNELQRIADLQKSITDSIRVCTQGRSFLKFLKNGTAKNGSTIVEHHKKRESLAKLLDPLTAISNLRSSLLETRDLIVNKEDFPKRIELCESGKALLASFEKYKCMKELGIKLNDTIDLVNNQALSFFNDYHKSSMDELRMFLENESWERLPVKSGFKLVQLKEFSFLRAPSPRQATGKLTIYQISYHDCNNDELKKRQHNDSNSLTSSLLDLELDGPYTIKTLGNPPPSSPVVPFIKILQVNTYTPDDVLGSTDSDDELDLELDQDFVEENSSSSGTESHYLLTRVSGPVLTNSSLNVLRLFGRYIQMMSVLEPISYEILMRIYNLLDHYTMVVFKKFGPESDKSTKPDDKNISPRLRVVIKSIRESLMGGSVTGGSVTSMINSTSDQELNRTNSTQSSGDRSLTLQQGAPNIANIIANDLANTSQSSMSKGSDEENQLIDPKKAIAVESLIFLVNQLWNLQEYLESLIPPELRPHLREQFTQTHSMVPDFLKARAEMRLSSGNPNTSTG